MRGVPGREGVKVVGCGVGDIVGVVAGVLKEGLLLCATSPAWLFHFVS